MDAQAFTRLVQELDCHDPAAVVCERFSQWVIEDDFDSEYRYEGHPVAPLHTLAPERVAYVGTFSKNVSPALRIGYAILPPGLQAGFKTLKRRWDLWNEGLQQKAMARFIENGFKVALMDLMTADIDVEMLDLAVEAAGRKADGFFDQFRPVRRPSRGRGRGRFGRD